MDFLKAFFNNKALTYDELVQAINAYNALPDNKEKQVKLANLGEGGYVSKDKYTALEATHNSKIAELTQANTLIGKLQESVNGNEALQTEIANYKAEAEKMQAERDNAILEGAIKVALLENGAEDVDYLIYKLKQDKDSLSLDENGKVKGIEEKITGLKTQYPNQFGGANGQKQVKILKLPNGDDKKTTPTKEDFKKMNYEERLALKKENEELYKNLAKN